MSPKPSLPKSELEIARTVWDLGEATVRQVVDALPAERKVDFWTVQTYLRRLASKGYLRVRQQGRTNVYSPRKKPGSVVKEVVEEFLQRVFDGEALPLFQHLIRDHKLSSDEIDQLQQTLNELKERKK